MPEENEGQGNSSTVIAEEETERSTKRRRNGDSDAGDDRDSENGQSPKRRVGSHDVLFRIVVPSRQIGRVIGKRGFRIQKIREETRATIKIADAVARHEDRVIIISSRCDDGEISDAENALHHIAGVVLKDDDDGVEPLKVGVGHVATNMIRLLIAGSQAGCLIGKSGQNIEELRHSSGAMITVLDQNQLPLCASAHESDRLVQISGDIPVVLKALEKIGCLLRENAPRKVISIRPICNFSSISSTQSYLAATSADYVTSEMTIPEALVGGLIGKYGSNISKIRTESGAAIKVFGGRGEQDHRQIHIGGTSQQVALAKQLVDAYIHSQLL